MEPTVIEKLGDVLTKEVIADIGKSNLVSIDPDSVDVLIQKALDDIENYVYDKTLNTINRELDLVHDHLDKWW